MTTQHTPGPWTLEGLPDGPLSVHASDDNAICDFDYGGYGDDPIPNAEANARLIAAAPDLLDCLERVREYGYSIDKDGQDRDGRNVMIAIEAAIAQAKGKESES